MLLAKESALHVQARAMEQMVQANLKKASILQDKQHCGFLQCPPRRV